MSRIEWRKVFSAVAVTSLVMTNIAPVSAAPALTRTESALRSKAQFAVRAMPSATTPAAGRIIPNAPASSMVEGQSPIQNFIIELSDEPAAIVFAKQLETAGFNSRNAPASVENAALAEAQAQVGRIKAAQESVRRQIEAVGLKELYSLQQVYNGVAIIATAEQAAEFAKLPGVKGVYAIAEHTIDNGSSVPLIGAPAVWDAAGLGATGDGLRVGIIDTGIDYFHATFGGNGLAVTTRTAGIVINPLTGVGFTGTTFVSTTKVVGGYDFAGDNYAFPSAPVPDGDPMDCPSAFGGGHGSHVAGTAAGYGVNTNGTTYTGTYGTGVDYSALRIGPGVAPNAQLYALRVFGCTGSTALTPLAIEWAMDPNGDTNMSDRLDVINMSLGSSFGSQYDVSAIASNNAVVAGVIVVASAGNSSDVNFITGSPGTAARALSVASSVDQGEILDGFQVLTGTLAGLHAGSRSANFNWATSPSIPLTATLVRPNSSNIYGCSAFDITDTAIISGNIVFLEWIDTSTGTFPCSSGARFNNAQTAGARGVILADRNNPLSSLIAGNTGIPGYIVPSPVGDALRANVPAGTTATGITLVFSRNFFNAINSPAPAAIDTLSSFSSRGIRRFDYGLKPDIAAPGQSIFSVQAGTGSQGTSLNGTSMAAPHMAGVMAILRELYPTWSVEQLKALAMNTAHNVVRAAQPLTSTLFGPQRVGAGRVDMVEATDTNVVAYGVSGDPGAVNVAFGMPQVTAPTAFTRTIHVDATNLGAGAVTYNTEYIAFSDIPGVTVTLSAPTVNATSGSETPVVVTMDINPAAMLRTVDPTLVATGRQWFSEEAGYALFIPQNAPFQAVLAGSNEVPPVTSPNSGLGSFTYDSAANALNYTVLVTAAADMTVTMAHIHLGYAQVNGPVQVNLLMGGPVTLTAGNVLTLTGAATLSALQEQYLLSGDMYVNIHTEAVPSGELRGQLLNVGPAALRVPVHGAPRPASDMSVALTSAPVGTAATAPLTFTLSGQGVSTADDLSLVTAFELHELSPKLTGTPPISNSADLWALGMTSNYTGSITTTTAFLGLATWGPWSTPTANDTEFDIYVDVGANGSYDFIFFNTGTPPAAGSAATDNFRLMRCTFPSCGSRTLLPTPLNMVQNGPAAGQNTNIFNNHVMVLPLPASALTGLNPTNTKIRYYVATFNRESAGLVDISGVYTYDLANPGVQFSGSVLPDLPVWADVPGAINATYSRANTIANGAQGVLFLHHHNRNGFAPQIVSLGANPDVTFIYNDLEDVVGISDTLHLAGAFNGWPGAGALMSADAGNTVFSITLPITPGTYEFKYQVNSGGVNWDMVNTANRSITVTTAPAQTRTDYRNVVPGYQVLQWPPTLQAAAGLPTSDVYGRVFVNGVTNGAGAGRGLRPELGYGNTANVAAWAWSAMSYQGEDGNNDEYRGVMTPTMTGVYSYAVRFNGNWGTGNPNNAWAYGDLDGVFPSEPFELENTGVMTVVQPALVRVVHAAPFTNGNTEVTVTVNGGDLLTNFAFGDQSGYVTLAPGSYFVEVKPELLDGAVAISGTLNVSAGMSYTVAAVGNIVDEDLGFLVLTDNLVMADTEGSTDAYLRLAHAVPNPAAASVDIRFQDGTPVITDFVYLEDSGYLPLPAGVYDLKITTPGGATTLFDIKPVRLSEDEIVTVFAVGDITNQPLGVLAVPDIEFLADARVRVVHAAPFTNGNTEVTVTVNGAPVASNFAFGAQTGYLDLAPGTYQVQVFAELLGGALAISDTFTLAEGTDYTVAAVGNIADQPLAFRALVDNTPAPATGFAKLRLAHAVPNPAAASVDIRFQDGTAVITDFVYLEDSGYLTLPTGVYDLKITTPGGATTLFDIPPVRLSNGEIVTVFAVGDIDNQPLGVLAVPSIQIVDYARVRVVHAAPFTSGNTEVTVTVNGAPVASNFAFGAQTGYLDLLPGTYQVQVFAELLGGALAISDTFTLTEGTDYTVAAVGNITDQPLAFRALVDNTPAPAAGSGKLRLVHAVPNPAAASVDVRFQDGTAVITDFVYLEDSDYLELPANFYDLKITTPGGATTLIDVPVVYLRDGDVVTVFAVGDITNQALGVLPVPGITLAQQIFLPIINR